MYFKTVIDSTEDIREMFNDISGRYDFLNHFLSFGFDIIWRKKMINGMKKYKPQNILDVATGTGDLAIAMRKIKPQKIIGIDIAEKMLEKGRKKIKRKKVDSLIQLLNGNAEALPFNHAEFDAVVVAFGVRNFQNLDKGLSEMYRVLKNDGNIWVLEFSIPKEFPVKQMYHFYFKKILPFIGRLISKNHSAYQYLPESVQEFPYGKAFLLQLRKIGFENVKMRKLSFGIATIYYGKK